MLSRFNASALVFALALQACGKKGDLIDEQGIASANKSSKGVQQNTDPYLLPKIDYSYAQVAALSELETMQSEIRFVSKSGERKFVFSMADGSAYLYDDASESVMHLPAVVQPSQSDKVYLVARNSGWLIQGSKVTNFFSTSMSSSGAAELSRLAVDLQSQNLTPLSISENQILLKSESNLILLSRKLPTELHVEKIYPDGSLGESLNEALSAGFASEKRFLWISTPRKVFFFDLIDGSKGFNGKPWHAELGSNLAKAASYKNIAIDFDNQKRPVGGVIFFADGKIFVSGKSPLSSSLSWEIDIRPLSEQYCLNCHGSNGAGGFSRADEAGSWTGVKRESIIARVYDQKTMPPANSPAGMAMTHAQREKIMLWLSGGAL